MAANRRDDAHEFTRDDLDRLTEALKNDEFRKLLVEYCEEVRSPEAQSTYRREMTELERERGFLVTFVTPSPGYVIKSSVGGDKKAFLNVCGSEEIGRPSYTKVPTGGVEWRLPHSLAPPRDDYDKALKRCIVYDVVFHPHTLHMAARVGPFRKMLTQTALDAVETNHKVRLDRNNVKFPKLAYKGMAVPAVIRKPDPDFKPDPAREPSLIDELYPQKSHLPSEEPIMNQSHHKNDSEYTTPMYTIKHRRDVDMKEFTYEQDAKKHSAIPTSLVVQVNLPLLSKTADATLDVADKSFSLISESPAKYKLDLTLPYRVNDKDGSAKFDLAKRTLTVVLPVVPSETPWRHRDDSGVESDVNSPCHSDEDNSNSKSSSSPPGIEVISESEAYRTSDDLDDHDDQFLDKNVVYSVPAYLCHVFDNIVALTLEVKNVDPDSLVVLEDADGFRVKFASIGSGFFPLNYALNFKMPPGSKCGRPTSEVWDNNVVLQTEICETELLDHVFIGLHDTIVKHDLEKAITTADIHTEKQVITDIEPDETVEEFLHFDLDYAIPNYNLNVIENMIAFTIHEKFIQNDSFHYQHFSNNCGLKLKFASLHDKQNSHYALCMKFPNGFVCEKPSIDIGENNMILYIEMDTLPKHFYIGLTEHNLKKQMFDKTGEGFSPKIDKDKSEPDVEVTTMGMNELSISLRKNNIEDSPSDKIKLIPKRIIENYDSGICSSNGSFKGILKCKNPMVGRSFSESHVDLVEYNGSPAYSLNSTDCIPEEASSLKKTVRFSNIITKQTFRSNSSILGQKSKNQRKKRNKKKALERRSSEGDPNDTEFDNEDVFTDDGSFKANDYANAARRDSGLTDTDDGDSDKGENDKSFKEKKVYKNEKYPVQRRCDANNGKYQEVNFKNDLIFDLDM